MGSTHTQINLWASIYGRPDFIERIACFAGFWQISQKSKKTLMTWLSFSAFGICMC